MNDHDPRPQELFDQLNALLGDGKPGKDRLVNAMTDTHPQADAQFQRRLEDQLLMQLKAELATAVPPAASYERKLDSMQANPVLIPPARLSSRAVRQGVVRHIPVTLAAALFAALVGVTLLFINNLPSGGFVPAASGFEAQQTDAAPACTPGAGSVSVYVVQSGDTLASIAQQANVELAALLAANCLNEASATLLQVGQTLYIPVSPNMLPPNALTATAIVGGGPTLVPSPFIITATPVGGAAPAVLPSPIIVTATIAGGEVTPVPPDGIPANVVPAAGLQPVVIALVDIPYGTPITADMLAVTYWQPEQAPRLTADSIDDVVGLYAISAVARYQPVIVSALVESLQTANGDPVLPPGTVAISVRMENILAPDGLQLTVGSMVDVWANFLFVSADSPPNTRPVLRLERMIVNARVVQIGTDTQVSAEVSIYSADIIVLAVTPHDAEVFAFLLQSGVPILLVPGGEIPVLPDNVTLATPTATSTFTPTLVPTLPPTETATPTWTPTSSGG